LICQTVAFKKIVHKIDTLIHDDEFITRHRISSKAFTRNRRLTFAHLMCFFINMVKSSVFLELSRFFDVLSEDTDGLAVTPSAFTQARRSLKATAFIELSNVLTSLFLQHQPRKVWRGFRLLAVDGSTVNLPNTAILREHFGSSSMTKAQARASQLYDVQNRLTLDAFIYPLKRDERSLALKHLTHTCEGDLLIYDRGYPSFDLFMAHQEKHVDFCARVPLNFHKDIAGFIESGKSQQIITMTASGHAKSRCRKMNLSTEPLTLRMVRVDLPSGETEVLFTSVLDANAIPCKCFKELYHQRWGVEEDYKLMKSRLVVEHFSGKSVHAIEQDFHAKILTKNIMMFFVESAQTELEEKTSHRQLSYRVNTTGALGILKDRLVRMICAKTPLVAELNRVIRKMSRNNDAIRPERNYKRVVRQGRKYFTSYKQPC
jgi:hypothetical protein